VDPPPTTPRAPDPPGPRGWPLLGILPAFGRDPLAFLEGVKRKYGAVSFFRFVRYRMWLVTEPEDIETLLVKHHQGLHKDHIYEALKPLVGEGLLTSEDALWRRQRKLAAPAFRPRQIEGYAETMVRRAEAYASALYDGAVRDLRYEMMALTMGIVNETLFGIEGDFDRGVVTQSIDFFMNEGFAVEARGWRAVLPYWVPTPGRWRVKRAIERLDAQLMPFIRARRRGDSAGDDLLGRLIAARDEDGSAMSDRQVRDEVVTLFFAGHETTALALLFSLVLLAQHPAARSRLEAEVDEVVGDRPPRLDDLERLPFVAGVIHEAMRLYPPAWLIAREATQDLPLREHRIRRGDQVVIAPWLNHRDPRWFDAPLAFRPERWLGDLADRLPRMAYMPFGGGPRVCIGNHFALAEMRLVLAALTRQLRLEWTGTPPIVLDPSVSLRVRDPVNVRVRRRRS